MLKLFLAIEDLTQILKPTKNILHPILLVTSFLLSKVYDVKTQKSRFKYEVNLNAYYKLYKNQQKQQFGFFVVLLECSLFEPIFTCGWA